MRQPVVYVLTSTTGRALYIGVTTDLPRRLEEHGLGRVIHIEPFEIAPNAIAREKQLKGWTRAKKIALINRSNPDWRDLAGEIDG